MNEQSDNKMAQEGGGRGTFTGPIASQYPGFLSWVVQYTVRSALYAKGSRAAAGLENQSGK